MTEELFDQEHVVRVWMQDLAAIAIDNKQLPSAQQLWWKAQLLKRWDTKRRAVGPIERAEPVQIGVGMAGALTLLAWLWRSSPVPNSVLIVATVVGLSLLAAVGGLALRRS